MSIATETTSTSRAGGAIQCVVVTPESTLLDERVASVTLPLFDGSYGIMPGHSPVVGRLGFGELKVKAANGTTSRYFVDGGFVQVRDDVVTVLTNNARAASQVDSLEAAKALEAARLRPAKTPAEQDEKEQAVARARALLHFANSRS
jgi:F-type H+-transporting ATPase subunit epsilon